MNTWTDQELDAIQDAHHREDAWAAEDLPQTGGRVVLLQKTGPAFTDTPRAFAATTVLTAAGEVLDAIDRRVVLDVIRAWDRLLDLVGASVVRLPNTCEVWGTKPWGRLTLAVTRALCYTATEFPKWGEADALICAWVRLHRDQKANELRDKTHLTDYDLSEDGPADPAYVEALRNEVDLLTRFLAGVK